ncbi:NAD-dependent epimerase/dehydratase family protein [Stenotrophomonas sp.]|uniref:NAD-dependent epimerase/dehydratase family protein n=1 Tax=Stenotrophomonas sp. TaxID=69392 RepID=UPI0028AF4ED2|nr:NAD-dependent epimerase/dehydratase family protein [Stenotrophomonas sp.]
MSSVTPPVLVIGGAGYIGSHVVRLLFAAGRDVVVVDDLSTGSANCVAGSWFYAGDLFAPAMLTQIVAEHCIDTIIYAAATQHELPCPTTAHARLCVESPLAAVFNTVVRSGVSKVVFTSTCAVYGPSRDGCIVDETCPTVPLSPYGVDKLAVEQHLLNLSREVGLRCVVLRCFNVAGAYRGEGFSGTSGNPARLVNVACQVAAGRRANVPVFGWDFPTKDGTSIRDYADVDDVARAHVNAVDYLNGGGSSIVLNCGSGQGHSLIDVVRAVEIEARAAVPLCLLDRRLQEVPFMVANIAKIRETLGWVPRTDSLLSVVRSALACEREI